MNNKKPFGMSVRAWRNRRGLSQEALAARAGLHRTYVCDVERGARNLSLESIQKLAGALEISIPTLLDYAPDLLADGAGGAAGRRLDLLLVEDLADDVEMTLRALQRAGITNRIRVLPDGAAALDYLFGADKHIRPPPPEPQLVLLDLYLPKVDGFEVLRQLKQHPETRAVPVIVLTASTSGRDLATCQRLGADAFIPKPVHFKSLTEVAPKLHLQWALLSPAAGPGPLTSSRSHERRVPGRSGAAATSWKPSENPP